MAQCAQSSKKQHACRWRASTWHSPLARCALVVPWLPFPPLPPWGSDSVPAAEAGSSIPVPGSRSEPVMPRMPPWSSALRRGWVEAGSSMARQTNQNEVTWPAVLPRRGRAACSSPFMQAGRRAGALHVVQLQGSPCAIPKCPVQRLPTRDRDTAWACPPDDAEAQPAALRNGALLAHPGPRLRAAAPIAPHQTRSVHMSPGSVQPQWGWMGVGAGRPWPTSTVPHTLTASTAPSRDATPDAMDEPHKNWGSSAVPAALEPQ